MNNYASLVLINGKNLGEECGNAIIERDELIQIINYNKNLLTGKIHNIIEFGDDDYFKIIQYDNKDNKWAFSVNDKFFLMDDNWGIKIMMLGLDWEHNGVWS